MTRDDIQNVIERFPNLTGEGFGLGRDGVRRTPEQRADRIAAEQAELLGRAEISTKVCAWLADKPRLKNINQKHSSYGWKHVAEKQLGEYVSNGEFIVAALHCGLKVDWAGDLNAAFNLAESVYKNAVARHGIMV